MRSIVYHPITFVLCLILATLLYLSLEESAKKADVSTRNVALLEQEVATVAQEVDRLETALDSAGQPYAKERVIRNELRKQLPGDVVFQIAELEVPELEVEPAAEEPSVWDQWLKVLW